MKATGIIGTTILSLLLGTAALGYAQQDQDKPAPQDEKAQKDKSAKQEDKSAKQPDQNRAEEKNAQQENKNNNRQEEKNAQQQNKDNNKQDENNARQQSRNDKRDEKNTEQAHRSRGGRIPDDRFRANFGREHSFRVSQADYSRDRRFQYGGYSFVFVDEWPGNWLYTQDVFVVEIGGVYYLCNAAYPGVNIALSIAE
jgi:phage repressor protein C with HTH and peptisase S24 domain